MTNAVTALIIRPSHFALSRMYLASTKI